MELLEILVHGKSTVCKIITQISNAKIIDADEIAKSLDFLGSEYVNKISKLFGQDVLNDRGSLNRKKLGDFIYTNLPNKLALDKITFQYVGSEFEKRLEVLRSEKLDFIVLDVPLLFESELNKLCDFVISVIANTELKIKRIQTRDNIAETIARQRLSIQKDDNFFSQNSDFVIENNGDKELIKKSLEMILNNIK